MLRMFGCSAAVRSLRTPRRASVWCACSSQKALHWARDRATDSAVSCLGSSMRVSSAPFSFPPVYPKRLCATSLFPSPIPLSLIPLLQSFYKNKMFSIFGGDTNHDKRLLELGFTKGAHVELGGLKKQDFLFLNGQTAKVLGLQVSKTGMEQILVKLNDEGSNRGHAYALKAANVFLAAPLGDQTTQFKPNTSMRHRNEKPTRSSVHFKSDEPMSASSRRTASPAEIISDASFPPEGTPVERRLWLFFFLLNVVLSVGAIWVLQSRTMSQVQKKAPPPAGGMSLIREVAFANASSEQFYTLGAQFVERARVVEVRALEVADKIRNGGSPVLDFYVLDKNQLDDVVIRKNSGCKWLPTTMCSPYGHGQSKQGRACDEKISVINSGICFCGGSLILGKACGGRMQQETFTCSEICEERSRILEWSLNSNADPSSADFAPKVTERPASSNQHHRHPNLASMIKAAETGGGSIPKVAMVTIIMGTENPIIFFRTIRQHYYRSHNDKHARRVFVFMPPDSKVQALHADLIDRIEKGQLLKEISDLVTFVPIDKKHWVMPAAGEIPDPALRDAVLEGMRDTPFKLSRFFAFFFQNYPVLDQFDYFWRIHELSILLCEIPYDPIRILRNNGKLLGFNSMGKLPNPSVEALYKDLDGMAKKDTELYNSFRQSSGMCSIDPSFTVGDLSWMRTDEYTEMASTFSLSTWMAASWGDGAFLSVMASLKLRREQLHLFESVGTATAKTIVHIPSDPSICPSLNTPTRMEDSCIDEFNTLSAL